MCDEWMSGLTLSLTREEFDRLPRHPSFRYELIKGTVYITPRPRHHHALLSLRPWPAQPDCAAQVAPLAPEDWMALTAPFAAAFRATQPFAGLGAAQLREAAEDCLKRTADGGDGPCVAAASFVARTPGRDPLGALLVTLLPDRDLSSWAAYSWDQPPPEDCVERRLGRPHLTWLFVDPWHARRGLGTALLAASVNALVAMGYRELLSTFLLGNDASALWHWRNGFRLLGPPADFRPPVPRPAD